MNRDQLLHLAHQAEQSWYAFFLQHWNIAVLVLMGITFGGIVSVANLPLESTPEIKIPIGIVTTVYPGASPADVEKLVTDRMEERLKNLDDVDEITSTSSDGFSSIVVEFAASADIDQSMQDLRDEVDIAKSDLPDGAEDPAITEVRAGDSAILTISLYGSASKDDLKYYAEELEDILESIPGVSRVDISGLERKEMQVLVDIQKLESFNLSIADVVTAVRSEHVDVPVGTLLTDDYQYKVSWRGQFDQADELAEQVVANKGGQNILLRDIAEVREVFAAPDAETKVFVATEGVEHPSVTLQIFKRSGADLVRIVDQAKEKMVVFQRTELPPHINLLLTSDYSEYIREDISTLLRGALQTILLIGLVLFLMIGKREAGIAAFSMPILYLLSFIVLFFAGETLNFLVLFALIISLGIVVDNAIVIVEGIYDHMNTYDLSAEDAAMGSVALYSGPLLSATLTTIAAFVPLALMSGIIGQYVSHIPVAITITLVASLFTAILLVPPVAAKILARGMVEQKEKPPFMERYILPVRQWYGEKITGILHAPRTQRRWVLAMGIGLILAIGLPVTGILRVQMFPVTDEDYFFVSVEAAAGTSLERTRDIAAQAEELIRKLPEVQEVITTYGGTAVGGIQGGGIVSSGSAGSNEANITVNLVSSDDRDHTSEEITDALREQVKSITDAHVTVSEATSGPPSGAPVEVRIIGEDLLVLEEFARTVQRELEQVDGTKEVNNDIATSTGDFYFVPKRDRLTYFGVTGGQIAQILRTSVFGDDSINIIRSGEETPIVVRLDFRDEECMQNPLTRIREMRDQETICRFEPKSVADLQNLLIPTPRGNVPLGEMVEISLQPAVASIRHLDGEKIVRVTANVRQGFVAAQVVKGLQEHLASSVGIPEGVEVRYGGENEDINESFMSLAWAEVVAILLIFAILVYEFNSFKQVFIILCTIPLALIGVFFGLVLLGKNLSFPGMIGLAALSGIVVNDAIVLVDRINRNRHDGMAIIDAIVDAGKDRLQPILITTLTTSLGMIPLIFSGDMFGDLAATVAIGVVFATVLTLVMVPIFYLNFETGNLAKSLRGLWHSGGEKLNYLFQKHSSSVAALDAA
ncbi:MAG: efflux RND transporter permease subunit [Candidatus Peribacteraceae bacterium]|jgi:multidrug efflux pump subunit AcrB